MEIPELQAIAHRTRVSREFGIGLLIGSALLALFLYVPLAGGYTAPASAVVAAPPPDAFNSLPPLIAKAAIVYDLATGKTLYESNADAQLPLASLTKLLTVYAALVELPPDTPITISAEAVSLGAPPVLSVSQTFPLDDLARLTLTGSLNEGAAAIADAAAGHYTNRVGVVAGADRDERILLAGAAASLGLVQTYAVNSSGLDENAELAGGYGSARDLARLSGTLVAQAPAIAFATTQGSAEATSSGGTRIKAANTNPLVERIPRLLLSKTGYTRLAGGNLALVFDVGINHHVAVVLLGSTETARFSDGMALVSAALAHYAGLASL